MFSIWAYVIVALAIASIAFGIGQIAPGFGMVFAILASTLWTAYSVTRQRRLRHKC